MILVIGATGKVGHYVVNGLLERGAPVRALTRNPDAARLPVGVEIVPGDLTDPKTFADHVSGVEAVFLLWPFLTAEAAAEVVDTLAGDAGRIVYLSAEAAGRRPDSVWASVERAVERSASEWTFLRPTGFAANTLIWSGQIRRSGVVRWVYGRAARSLIHERDVADIAVRALTEDGHLHARYELTGPEALTQVEQVRRIGDAIGRALRWEEVSPDEIRDQLAGVPASALDTWASFVDSPEVVTSTVREVTGRPARSFRQWARDHAMDFR